MPSFQDRPHCTNMNTRPPVACLCGVRACSRHARVIVAAANADTAAVGDNAEGGGARTETEMTKEELQARINKQVRTNGRVCSSSYLEQVTGWNHGLPQRLKILSLSVQVLMGHPAKLKNLHHKRVVRCPSSFVAFPTTTGQHLKMAFECK